MGKLNMVLSSGGILGLLIEEDQHGFILVELIPWFSLACVRKNREFRMDAVFSCVSLCFPVFHCVFQHSTVFSIVLSSNFGCFTVFLAVFLLCFSMRKLSNVNLQVRSSL